MNTNTINSNTTLLIRGYDQTTHLETVAAVGLPINNVKYLLVDLLALGIAAGPDVAGTPTL